MWSTHFQIGATRTITNIVAKEQNFYAKLNNEILQRYFIYTYIHTYIDIYIGEYSQNLFQVATLFMLEHVADAPGEYGKL